MKKTVALNDVTIKVTYWLHWTLIIHLIVIRYFVVQLFSNFLIISDIWNHSYSFSAEAEKIYKFIRWPFSVTANFKIFYQRLFGATINLRFKQTGSSFQKPSADQKWCRGLLSIVRKFTRHFYRLRYDIRLTGFCYASGTCLSLWSDC